MAPEDKRLSQVNPATQTADALLIGDPTSFKKVAVSAEPAGGLTSPQGKIVLIGDL